MSDQGIKSRPRYQPIARGAGGRVHLLVCDTATVPAAALADGTTVTDFDERWTIGRLSTAIPDPHGGADHVFRAPNHLLIALRRRLERETMGLRLYAIGTEPFVWDVAGVAREFAMSPAELALNAQGSGARRVFCNHCRTITPGVTTNIVTCSGCGAHLFVRDHFSRRLNAFAGVQVDAEVPGEIPAIEELYR